MKYVINLLIFLISLGVNAQEKSSIDKNKRNLQEEIWRFLTLKRFYTTINPSYKINFYPLPHNNFLWNNPKTKKFFQIEEIINKLDQTRQDSLAKALRDQKIESLRDLAISSVRSFLQGKPDWVNFPWIVLNDSIIDPGNCYWKKVNGTWQLANRIDTIPEKYKEFYTLQRVNMSVKPRDRGYVYNHKVEFYYDSQDTSITNLSKEILSEKIFNDKYNIDSTIDGLVKSKNYRSIAFDVPVLLSTWLSEHLKNMRFLLPQEWRIKVVTTKITFDRVPNDTLWIKSNESRKKIYVSPFLIRAVYMKYMNENFDNEDVVNLIDSFNSDQSKPLDYYVNMRDKIKKDFQSYFTFLFLHELGHIKYNSLDIQNIEEYCDCKAVQVMNNNKLELSLGIFEKILVQAIIEGETSLWDGADANSVIKRLNILKTYKEKNNLDCITISKK